MIRIHTLGGLSVRDADGTPLAGPATQPRRLAILALLARAGERGMTRDKFLALLWPDADAERGPRALAQALYAVRKELGAEDVIVGTKELRLDPALASSDVSEFASAVSRGDDARVAELYQGPFLDGFHLAGADEFTQWMERERSAIAHDYVRSLESLARADLARGDTVQSLIWWRRITGLDPLNARFTMGLMEALTASGDRAGALKQAHVYQLLVDQELDLPPDREVMVFAERLRAGTEVATNRSPSADGAPAPVVVPAPPAVEATITAPAELAAAEPRTSATASARGARHRLAISIGGIAAAFVAIAIVGYAAWRARGDAAGGVVLAGDPSGSPVVAVGQIASYGTDSTARALAGPVSDLLSTSLARAPGLRVVSRGRILELMRLHPGPNGSVDTTAGAFVDAARRAGGTQIVDGTVYVQPGGKLRLDLRRVDLATGAIGDVHTVQGTDLFSLVDSGTARLVSAFGGQAPIGPVADVTTRSVAAYRMYEQGIRAYFGGDYRTALTFFEAAVGEDSLFALATYQSAIASQGEKPESVSVRLERAKRLASRAPDRERLTILAGWAHAVASPTLRQLADTLLTRYPTEVEGYLYTGISRVYAGEFMGGVPALERAIAMDSLGARGPRPSCPSCEALRWLVSAYELADSFPAAERTARRWARLQPGAFPPANRLAEVLEYEGRGQQADSAFHAAAPADPSYDDVLPFRALHLIRAGRYQQADRLLMAKIAQAAPAQQLDANWLLAISLREQGRLDAALDATRRIRPLAARVVRRGTPKSESILEAQIQLEAGRPGAAVALFDSIAVATAETTSPTGPGAGVSWILTHVANAAAAARDTIRLPRLADSVRVLGSASAYGRDQRLFHHIRGLLFAARGNDAEAIAEFRAAIYSTTGGYTRTSYELARLLLRDQRPRDAIGVLQPALRGPLEASNLYVNRTELHELLARAWDAAGVKDSAVTHYALVARAWSAGDPPFKARAESARRRAAELGSH